MRRRPYLYLFGLGFLYRVLLLWWFPALYGGDSVGRLYYRDSIFFGHWLPFLQAVIVASYKLTQSVMAVRVIIIAMASTAAMMFYDFVRRLAGERAGFIAGLLFTFSPLYVYLSLVPYQEVIFLGLLVGALAFLFDTGWQRGAGFLLYGLACLTRYEAWFLLPVVLVMEIRRTGRTVTLARLKQLFLFVLGICWGPFLWIAMSKLHWGEYGAFLFLKGGTAYFWQPEREMVRIIKYAGRMLGWIIKFGSPAMLLAPLGLYFFRKKAGLSGPMCALAWLTSINLIFLTFVTGREFDNDFRFAAIPVVFLMVFAAIGVLGVSEKLAARSSSLVRRLLGVCGLLLLTVYAALPVFRATEQPENSAAYAAAGFLNQNLAEGETAVVLAAGFRDYPQVVPMPCQRVGAQLNAVGQRVFCSTALPVETMAALARLGQRENVRYIVQFGEFEPWTPTDVVLMEFLHQSGGVSPTVFREGEVRIVRVNSWDRGGN